MSAHNQDIRRTHAAWPVVVMSIVAALFILVPRLVALSALADVMPWAPVYTVADLTHHLAQEPRAWLGRTVRVRGEPVGRSTWLYGPPATGHRPRRGSAMCCPEQLLVMDPRLVDLDAPGAPGFALVLGAPDPWLTALRRVPVVGSWVPGPQELRWGVPTIYRIHLEAVAGPGHDTVTAVLEPVNDFRQ